MSPAVIALVSAHTSRCQDGRAPTVRSRRTRSITQNFCIPRMRMPFRTAFFCSGYGPAPWRGWFADRPRRLRGGHRGRGHHHQGSVAAHYCGSPVDAMVVGIVDPAEVSSTGTPAVEHWLFVYTQACATISKHPQAWGQGRPAPKRLPLTSRALAVRLHASVGDDLQASPGMGTGSARRRSACRWGAVEHWQIFTNKASVRNASNATEHPRLIA